MIRKTKFFFLNLFLLFSLGCQSTPAIKKYDTYEMSVSTPNCSNSTCRLSYSDKAESEYVFIDPPEIITLRESDSPTYLVCYEKGSTLPESLEISPGISNVVHPLSCSDVRDKGNENEEDTLEKEPEEKEPEEKEVEEKLIETQINSSETKSSDEIDSITQNLLDQLEDLFQKGLISKQMYEKEKKTILNK